MTSRFAIATREELWTGGRRVESRLTHGVAHQKAGLITATDERPDALVERCEREIEVMREAVVAAGVPQARLIADCMEGEVASIIVVTLGILSVVTSSTDLAADWQLLRECSPVAGSGPGAWRGIPLVWRHGSAAVLLHEAAGHAAEHGHPPVAWPPWLTVTDAGEDLLGAAPALTLRRASFTDVPLRRMRDLVVAQEAAPFALPERRIEVLLVEGGSYEPLTEEVAVRVAAARIVGEGVTRDLDPFTISASRAEVARSLAGATGAPIRYPGVICSREGQELFVRSSAPVVITVFA